MIVALDNDPAGIKASRHAHDLLLTAGVTNPDTITLPPGHDPAQVLADHGPDVLADTLTRRRPLADLVVDDITGYWLELCRSCSQKSNRKTGCWPGPSSVLKP